jgi:SOS response regulatory protein OraA/RecX
MPKIKELLPKGKQFYRLVLEDEVLVIHQETVIAYNLFTKDALDQETLKKLKKSDAIAQAKSYALKKLSTKNYTPKRLKDALSMVNYSQDVIHHAITDLTKLGYINEEKSFELLLSDFLDYELKGKNALIDKLKKEGFKKVYIEKLDDLFPSDLELSKAKTLIDQSHQSIGGASYLKKKQSLKAKLYQKGFSHEITEEAILYFEKHYLDFDEESALKTLIESNKRYNLSDYKDKNRFIQKLLRDGFHYEAIKKYLK